MKKIIAFINTLYLYVRHYFIVSKPLYDNNINYKDCIHPFNKVAFYIGCQDGRSDRYRVYNIVEALQNQNIWVDIYTAESIRNLLKPVDYDLLICFREDRYRFLNWDKIAANLHKCGVKIIYDTDDYTIDERYRHASNNVLQIIKTADAITVTTDYLATQFHKATKKPVYVVKNTINNKQMIVANKIKKLEAKNNTIKIVYQSGSPSHNKDFKQVEKALLNVLKRYANVELHIFGPLDLTEDFDCLKEKIIFHPYMDYLHLEFYVSEMDINIAPLECTVFNHSKSELKIFEAALLGIPTICSPVSSYKQIIKDGVNGILANNTKEWIHAFELLLEDEVRRKNIGNKAREEFVPIYSINNEIFNVINIFSEVFLTSKTNL